METARRWSFLLACVMSGIFVTSSVALAEDCPTRPADGWAWSVAELNALYALNTYHATCCCVNNTLGDWTTLGHSAVMDGCACPSVPFDWECDQIFYTQERSVTPTSDDNKLLPPPPPAGWGSNSAATLRITIYCSCTQNGNPAGEPACIQVQSNYVPVLYTNCTGCPYV